MKDALYPLILVISLSLAYWASLPTEKGQLHRELWLSSNISPELIIKYQDKEKITTIQDGWVTVEKIVDDTPMPPLTFRSNRQLNRVRDKLLDLYAEKVIGDANDLDLKDYELDQDTSFFEIGSEGSTKRFVIGKRSFQTSNVYVLDKSRQKVILVQREPFNILRNPKARLFEARPFKFRLIDDVSHATISRGDKSLEMILGKDDKNKVFWTKPNEKETLESEGSWIRSLLRLKITKYAIGSEEKKLAKLTEEFQVNFTKNGEPVEQIKLYKLEKEDEQTSYWVKSNYLNSYGMVDGTKAKTLLQDISSFLK